MIDALVGLFGSRSRSETNNHVGLVRPLAVIDSIPTNLSLQNYYLMHLRQHGREDMIGRDILNRPGMIPMKAGKELDILLSAINAEWHTHHKVKIIEVTT